MKDPIESKGSHGGTKTQRPAHEIKTTVKDGGPVPLAMALNRRRSMIPGQLEAGCKTAAVQR